EAAPAEAAKAATAEPAAPPAEALGPGASFAEQLKAARALLEQPAQRALGMARFEALRQANPKEPEVPVALGDGALEERRVDGAGDHYKDALAVRPNYPAALFGLGRAYRASGDNKQALAYYQAFLAGRPRGAKADCARLEVTHLRAAGN